MWKVQLFELNHDGRELQAAVEVIRGAWITMGEKTEFAVRNSLGYFAPSSIPRSARCSVNEPEQ
jgi:hypothetical protein